MRKTVAILIVFSLSAISAVGSTRYVYTAALSPNWEPTVYKIDIYEGRTLRKMKVNDEGAPMFIFAVTPSLICFITEEGIASNGTSARTPTAVKIYFLSAEDLKIQKVIALTGWSCYDLVAQGVIRVFQGGWKRIYRFYRIGELSLQEISRPPALSDPGQPSPVSQPLLKRFKDEPGYPKDEIPLAFLPKRGVFVTLSHKLDEVNLRLLSVRNGLKDVGRISLRLKDKAVRMPFENDSLTIEERYLVTVFEGASYLGHYSPSYVLILDLENGKRRWVKIGSDPPIFKSITAPNEAYINK
jgi:hypothetical protein